ncbi:MAG: AraC family transcriptional regulator [Devosia sp.]
MVATSGRTTKVCHGGLDQFTMRPSLAGVEYCVSGASPYALEFENGADVICLLLGDIVSRTQYEDDREHSLIFRGETTAFHPRHGRVKVAARSVRHGFIAFSYSDEFQKSVSDISLAAARLNGSVNNIQGEAIRHLARYARERLATGGDLDPLEIQYLGGLVYVETIRSLDGSKAERPAGISDTAFRRITEFVEAELETDISCDMLAKVADLPLRSVFQGIRLRTGLSPYQFVINARLARARHLLESSNEPISDIALACGFASQQHLTATMSRKLGSTPGRLRHD